MNGNQQQQHKAMEDIQKASVTIQWSETLELGYELAAADSSSIPKRQPVCFRCGKFGEKPLSKCARCNTAGYCSKDCQVQDWKALSKGGGGHKTACEAYGRLSIAKNGVVEIKNDSLKELIRNELFGRIRVYANAYAVHQSAILGRGFLFLQSDCTLATLSTLYPKDAFGFAVTQMRAILMHFLTLAEFDGEVCRDDFEMMQIRTSLQNCVKHYNPQTQAVVVMRFRCGHVAVGTTAALVPDYAVCKTIGAQYFANNNSAAVQLNLDDL